MVPLLAALPPLGAMEVVVDTVIDATRVTLDLDGADIQVYLESGGENLLQVRAIEGVLAAQGLELVRHDDGEVVLTRQYDPSTSPRPPHLTVDLLLSPGTPLRLSGHSLWLRMEPVAAPVPADPGTGSGIGPPGHRRSARESSVDVPPEGTEIPVDLELDLESSQVEIFGIPTVTGVVRRSDLQLTASTTWLDLDLVDTTGVIADHRGRLAVRAIGGQTFVHDSAGTSSLRLVGGETLVERGRGQLEVSVFDGAKTTLTDFQGDLVLRGAGGTIVGTRLRSSGRGIDIEGEDLNAIFQDCRSTINGALRGGRLEATLWQGAGTLAIYGGAEVDLGDWEGRLNFAIHEGGRGRVRALRGLLDANVHGARLEVEDTQRLNLVAQDAVLFARGIRHLAGFRANGTEVDLDLRSLQGNRSRLHLHEATHARVTLAGPCAVRIPGATEIPSGVMVHGCEPPGAANAAPEGTLLSLEISPDSEITVEGF